MVVEAGAAGSEGGAGEVVLDEAVDVDGGGGVAELDAGGDDEEERDGGVEGLEDLAVAAPPCRHC